jgi:aspartyl-tRNA(Asn)/glutamyl-tRNA(Gln) amidotransferase subunit C
MPTDLTRADAARIAALAKLQMTSEELDRVVVELAAILGYFEAIDRIDTGGIELATDTPGGGLRADAPLPSLARDDVFANAPDADRQAGLFRVPRVLGS